MKAPAGTWTSVRPMLGATSPADDRPMPAGSPVPASQNRAAPREIRRCSLLLGCPAPSGSACCAQRAVRESPAIQSTGAAAVESWAPRLDLGLADLVSVGGPGISLAVNYGLAAIAWAVLGAVAGWLIRWVAKI